MYRIRCTFVPQAWQDDYAIPVDPEGDTSWDMTVETLPRRYSLANDALREDVRAPQWVQDWVGPFEVTYVILRMSDVVT